VARWRIAALFMAVAGVLSAAASALLAKGWTS